ncbi:MAG: hypothetical protein ACOCRO_09145, partial [Halanaerobiales bacterium]
MEIEFLKALRREGITYYSIDLMNMKEGEFVGNVSTILEDYLIIPGIDDTSSICRNITRQLWTELIILIEHIEDLMWPMIRQ